MPKVALLRHTRTQWNLERRYQGHTDIPICEQGRERVQSLQLPDPISNFALYSSPLTRARQTLEILTDRPYEIAAPMIESDYGDWNSKTLTEVRQQYPLSPTGYDGLDYSGHNGETVRSVQDRTGKWLHSLKEDSFCVTHKGVMIAIYAKAVGWSIEGPPPVKIDFDKILLFAVSANGLELIECNIPLEAREAADASL